MEQSFFCPASREEWRNWLIENHNVKQSVWLVYYKKRTKLNTIAYSDAVDEALCFGWIDSRIKPIDDQKYMQQFSRRNEKSVWSKVNKEKVRVLINAGLMTEAGLKIVERAKENGSWNLLDEAEDLIVPADLEQALNAWPVALDYFYGLSRSDKRNVLQWLVLAKRPETRLKRINEIVECALLKQKPKQFRR